MPSREAKSSYSRFITGIILGSANPISIVFWISIIGKMLQARQLALEHYRRFRI